MSRVLLLGNGPEPDDLTSRIDFPRLRSWQFLRALLKTDLEVIWLCIHPLMKGVQPHERISQLEGKRYLQALIPRETSEEAHQVSRWLDRYHPDFVVSAGPFGPARAAARVPGGIPVFIDLPGDMMAEAQLRAQISGELAHIEHARAVLMMSLARGDGFSVVSTRQRLAALGQLGILGRLVPPPLVSPTVVVMPVAADRRWLERPLPLPPRAEQVVWPGAMNTWSDADTFFVAGERFLKSRADAHIVVTAGAIPAHDDVTYPEFVRRVEASAFRSRWRLPGWIEARELQTLLWGSRAAICLDRPCLEAELGSRTRQLHAACAGPHQVVTEGSELTAELLELGLATAVPNGDAEATAGALVDAMHVALDSPAREVGRAELLRRHAQASTTEGLLRWLERPCHAEQGSRVRDFWMEKALALEEELSSIQKSITWRVMGRVHRFFQRHR